jgi:hypothetical protein
MWKGGHLHEGLPGYQDHIWGVPKANALLLQKDLRINNSYFLRWKFKIQYLICSIPRVCLDVKDPYFFLV